MIRKYIYLVVLLFCCSFGFSQNLNEIKRLKHAITKAKEKDQVTLLSDLAWEYRAAYPDSSIYYALKAYALAEKLGDKKNLARPLNFIGLAYFHRGNHLDAFDYFNRALKIAETQRDSLQLAHAFNNVGRLFLEQGLLTKSYTYLSKSTAFVTSIKDASGIAYA